jgi:hypothetical protein
VVKENNSRCDQWSAYNWETCVNAGTASAQRGQKISESKSFSPYFFSSAVSIQSVKYETDSGKDLPVAEPLILQHSENQFSGNTATPFYRYRVADPVERLCESNPNKDYGLCHWEIGVRGPFYSTPSVNVCKRCV